MANPEQLAILKRGVVTWNQWREQNPRVTPDLTGADLREANLRGADLSGADLRGADLSEAYLTTANLSGANLSEAYLTAANLTGASLSEAYLTAANLTAANLSAANLTAANLTAANLTAANLGAADLSGADLSGAALWFTVLGSIDLRDVKGLGSCKHSGPSLLDFHTLAKSGPLPLAFLRGCGLSDQYIDYLPSLFNQAIQFYSCFISYSTKDQEFADRLYADLQNKGVRCWFAPHDIQGGEKIHEQIDESIRMHDRLLLILSGHSMESEWVRTEIRKARRREARDCVRVLFPISLVPFQEICNWECFDADTGKDAAVEIREYFIPDFCNWKDHDSYQEAFGRLMRDLKSAAATAG